METQCKSRDDVVKFLGKLEMIEESELNKLGRYILRLELFKQIVVEELRKMPKSTITDLLLRLSELTD